MPGLLTRRLLSLLLLAVAVGMGPGLALAEAAAHAALSQPGHGRRDHFEARSAQDHDDTCAVGVASALSRATYASAVVFRAPRGVDVVTPVATVEQHPPAPTLLPPSRGPPALA